MKVEDDERYGRVGVGKRLLVGVVGVRGVGSAGVKLVGVAEVAEQARAGAEEREK